MNTYFAPVERAEKDLLSSQVTSISNSPVMNAILQTTSGLLAVINENRQIVAFNNSFLEAVGVSDPEKVIGLRVGESLNCKYAFDEPGGCGTTRYCSSCGAAIAMMAAIDDHKPCEKICALKVEKNGHSEELCLSVRAQPFVVNRNRWILVYAQDVSQQQFWASIEDVFFHDINNMLCSMKSVSYYVHQHMPENELLHKLNLIADRVCREVAMQETLSHHKDKQYIVNLSPTSLEVIREQVFNTVLNKSLSVDKQLLEEGSMADITLSTDAMLVSRVLINMLLNAFEATEDGGSVKLTTLIDKYKVEWQVWNRAAIPDNVQLRLFQKFFSTKAGSGHGLGTYSMKFFGEECLGGKVSFTSTVADGTTFVFSLPREPVK